MQHIDTNRGWRCKNMEETMNFKNIKKEVERIKSGIDGLDNFMEGGFPKSSNIVLSGLQGTGKTLFGEPVRELIPKI
jgi:predicted ATP-dependent serine protease